MHALINTFRMDPARLTEHTAELHERIVPLVKHQPGFVSGHWTHDRERSRYVAFIAFETEAHARGLAAFLTTQIPRQQVAGIDLESVSVVEIMAHAVA